MVIEFSLQFSSTRYGLP